MITEAIIDVMSRVMAWLIDLLPAWDPPVWVQTAADTLADAIGYMGMYSGWVPMPAVMAGVTFLLACSALVLGIRVGRILLSLFTGGGGSAA